MFSVYLYYSNLFGHRHDFLAAILPSFKTEVVADPLTCHQYSEATYYSYVCKTVDVRLPLMLPTWNGMLYDIL